MLFCPHPPPLSHLVGEGCRGAARRPLSVERKLRFRTPYPPRPLVGEGGKGGEGKTKNAPRRIEAQFADLRKWGGVELHTPATVCRS